MTDEDRLRWDERYQHLGPPLVNAVKLPDFLTDYVDLIPTSGHALELACGQAAGAIWLALRGLEVWGLDVSSVAIDQACELASRSGVTHSCRFDVFDLDDGLPAGPAVDVILCHRFRDARLDRAVIERLAPGGLLAMACLSEVGARPGPFRAKPGELAAAFAELDVVGTGEGQGSAWLVARA